MFCFVFLPFLLVFFLSLCVCELYIYRLCIFLHILRTCEQLFWFHFQLNCILDLFLFSLLLSYQSLFTLTRIPQFKPSVNSVYGFFFPQSGLRAFKYHYSRKKLTKYRTSYLSFSQTFTALTSPGHITPVFYVKMHN